MKNVIRALTALAVLAAAAPTVEASPRRRTPVVDAVEKALPSVVNIGTERLVNIRYTDPQRRFRGDLFDQFFSEFFGPPPQSGYRLSHSLGSGVIIDEQGYILTNYHVIERASKIRVTLADESQYDAVFLTGDEISDLALIKIEPAKPLQAIELCREDDLMLGEPVIVLGNPFGLNTTVTVGVLSAKNREARYGGEVLYRDILQTDAAVNPGSSGGPLLNVDGELIGINVAIYREAQNIGFAVPVKRARELLAQWLSPRALSKLWLGFEPGVQNGAVAVSRVDTNSPAVAAGLRAGDVIRSVNGRPVADLYDFDKAMLGGRAGDTMALGLERGGETAEAKLVLTPMPKASGEQLASRLLGLQFTGREASAPAAKIGFSKGMSIAGVTENSAAAKVNLRPGLLVTRINDKDINTLDDVGLALENVRQDQPVSLVVVSIEEKGSFIMAQSSTVQVQAQ